MKNVAVLLLMVLLTLSPFTARAGTKSASMLRLDPQVALGAYQGLVEEHLESVLRTEKVVASSSEARSARWEAVRPLLESFARGLSTDATVWFAMPDGSYFTTESRGAVEQNLRDRSYFPRLLAGQDVPGDLVISKSTGHRSIVVATPVVENGKVLAIVGVSVRVRLLSQLVESKMPLPDDAYFYALDPEAKIVLHRYADRMFRRVDEVGDERLGNAFRAVMKNERGGFDYTLNGQRMSSVYSRSKRLGWYFFIARQRR